MICYYRDLLVSGDLLLYNPTNSTKPNCSIRPLEPSEPTTLMDDQQIEFCKPDSIGQGDKLPTNPTRPTRGHPKVPYITQTNVNVFECLSRFVCHIMGIWVHLPEFSNCCSIDIPPCARMCLRGRINIFHNIGCSTLSMRSYVKLQNTESRKHLDILEENIENHSFFNINFQVQNGDDKKKNQKVVKNTFLTK